MSRACRVLLLVVSAVVPAAATTYLPVTFEQLVERADVIFVGQVVDVRAFRVTNGNSVAIKTRVVFDVSESLLGAGTTESLEFLGGELDGVELRVSGMPRFQRGDRRLVFARREPSINPIVGFTQGVMTVAPDARGIDRVLAVEGPVAGVAVTLADLRLRVRNTLSQLRRQ